MAQRVWVRSPHSGGTKISPPVQERTRAHILAHAEARYAGCYDRIDVRFRGAFCYIDAYLPWAPISAEQLQALSAGGPPIQHRLEIPTHLCRLRYFGADDRWSLAFYTYSNEKYSPCMFASGNWFGTPEEGLDVGAAYLGQPA